MRRRPFFPAFGVVQLPSQVLPEGPLNEQDGMARRQSRGIIGRFTLRLFWRPTCGLPLTALVRLFHDHSRVLRRLSPDIFFLSLSTFDTKKKL